MRDRAAVVPGARGDERVHAGRPRSARSTAHDAPSTLNAGSPSRSDSSFTEHGAETELVREPVEAVDGGGRVAGKRRVERRGVGDGRGDRLGPHRG